jgi:hypothetical protein
MAGVARTCVPSPAGSRTGWAPRRTPEQRVNAAAWVIGQCRGGYSGGMTDPHDDMGSIADPGSMDPDTMTEPDNSLPGDLDADHEDLAGGGPGTPAEAADSPAAPGSPIGPPD